MIGDVHGRFLSYVNLLDGVADSVQVGDYGIGFPGVHSTAAFLDNMVGHMPGRHRFIRGNHDNPSEAMKSRHFIADGSVEEFAKGRHMMFVGGATSIDKAYRKEGVDWWPDEQLGESELQHIIDVYKDVKPEVVISHEAPHRVARKLFSITDWEFSATRYTFDRLQEIHAPKLWVFGHWHIQRTQIIKDTHFICLPELSYVDIDFETL